MCSFSRWTVRIEEREARRLSCRLLDGACP
jgi:hypothetical protein